MIRTVMRNVAGLRGRYLGFAVALAVLVGASSAGLIVSSNAPAAYEAQLDRSVADRTISVQSFFGSGTRVDDSTVAAFAALPGVAIVEPTYAMGGDLTFGDDANTQFMSLLPLRSMFVPPLAGGTGELGPRDVLIPEVVDGRSLAEFLGRDVTILRDVSVGPGSAVRERETLRVVGLVEQYWQVEGRNPVYLPPELARQWLGDVTGLGPGSIPAEGFTEVGILAEPEADPEIVLASVQALGFQAASAAQVGGEVPESLQSFVALSNAVRYAGVVVGLIVAFVFVRTILLSRLPEVGLLGSFGYSPLRIVLTLGGEVVLVALVAAVVGLALGAAAAFGVTSSIGAGGLPPGAAVLLATPSAGVAGTVVVGTALLVALAAAIPLAATARRPALEALRTRK